MPSEDAKPKTTQSKNHVRHLIRSAFKEANPSSNNKPISHQECIDLRSDLCGLGSDRLLIYLPQVLDDLLDTHTNKPGLSEGAEEVVRYLNVLREGTDLDFVQKHWGPEALHKTLQDEKYLREEALKDFNSFTREHAFAIWKWLEFARNWQDLEWDIKHIDAAICYWEARSK